MLMPWRNPADQAGRVGKNTGVGFDHHHPLVQAIELAAGVAMEGMASVELMCNSKSEHRWSMGRVYDHAYISKLERLG